MSSSEGGGCSGAVCRCLASIPCTVLCMFLAFIGATLACGGSLVVAFYRTRIVLNIELWPCFLYICLGVGVGMLVAASLFLVAATLSTKPTAQHLYVTGRRLRCIRGFNVVLMVLMLLLQLAWLVITVGLSIAVLYLLLIENISQKGSKCVNLAHYGIPRLPKQLICNDELPSFLDELKHQELLICYAVSLATAVVIVVSLTLFMINAASNYAHLGLFSRKSPPSRNDLATTSHMPIGGYHSYDGRPLATETAM